MSTNENQNKPVAGKEKKELTPQELQKRKKMIIFPLLFLLFAGSMWLIFAPSGDKTEEQKDGFNTDLPTPKESGIISDKRDAYMQEAMQSKQQEKMRSLQDFAFSLGEENETGEERVKITPQSPDSYEEPESGNKSSRSGNAFRTSNNAYQDVNRQLGSFYEEPATKTDEQAQLALESRIQELERQLTEEQERKSSEEDQLAMIEKSYAIAARYMGGGEQPSSGNTAQTVANTASGKVAVQPVAQVRHNVVSLLAAPMPDSVFMEEFVKPRNWGFNTVAGNEEVKEKNSISACVYQTVTITDGQEVGLRLLEPMMAGKYLIPANTVVNGSARITGERMGITINAVQHAGNVIPVELLVYDLDGGQGISVPGSEEINAVKEIAANMGSGMGSSITITDDAGSQLLADLGRSAIQGASQYVSKKMRTVKITLKAGYQVLLLPPMK
ncbi:conjugative transposon protein TraM [Parabacteroides faecis]|uniref:Conjugative transposon TraM protein n=1 Tax=Parabacteroides faecis TaxID=1217282 RepID=A0ABR6KUU5_9BACT|nr:MULTISPECIES: conjugative transposon protein TraM [Parabacteroides]MBB4625193.1 conjugative transposon TraM protein [Parabacteroides faecis]GGK19133.1 conjugative transposon protein TraM [Parabacteroides faecis]